MVAAVRAVPRGWATASPARVPRALSSLPTSIVFFQIPSPTITIATTSMASLGTLLYQRGGGILAPNLALSDYSSSS